MPTNWQQHKGLSKWTHRFKTMVRYRLLILTSAPIFLTLIALIGDSADRYYDLLVYPLHVAKRAAGCVRAFGCSK